MFSSVRCSTVPPEWILHLESELEQPLPRKRVQPPEVTWRRRLLLVFADDTTVLTRQGYRETVEAHVAKFFSLFGATIHPGKTERLRAALYGTASPIHPDDIDKPADKQRPLYLQSVRLVGGHIDSDGGTRADQTARLAAARRVWKVLF